MREMKSLAELVILVQKDDEEAFSQIVNSFKPLLVKESCRNGSFDEDCYQECMIRLFLALKKFEIREWYILQIDEEWLFQIVFLKGRLEEVVYLSLMKKDYFYKMGRLSFLIDLKRLGRGGLIVLLFLLWFFVGSIFGVIIMCCLAVGKYDDITSGRE